AAAPIRSSPRRRRRSESGSCERQEGEPDVVGLEDRPPEAAAVDGTDLELVVGSAHAANLPGDGRACSPTRWQVRPEADLPEERVPPAAYSPGYPQLDRECHRAPGSERAGRSAVQHVDLVRVAERLEVERATGEVERVAARVAEDHAIPQHRTGGDVVGRAVEADAERKSRRLPRRRDEWREPPDGGGGGRTRYVATRRGRNLQTNGPRTALSPRSPSAA